LSRVFVRLDPSHARARWRFPQSTKTNTGRTCRIQLWILRGRRPTTAVGRPWRHASPRETISYGWDDDRRAVHEMDRGKLAGVKSPASAVLLRALVNRATLVKPRRRHQHLQPAVGASPPPVCVHGQPLAFWFLASARWFWPTLWLQPRGWYDMM
jgi:hypothetical protein